MLVASSTLTGSKDFTPEELERLQKHRVEIERMIDIRRNKRYEINRDLFEVSGIIAAICFAAVASYLPLNSSSIQKLFVLPAILAGIFSAFTATISGYLLLFKWHEGELRVATALLSTYTGKTGWKLKTKAEKLLEFTMVCGMSLLLLALIGMLIISFIEP